MKGRESVLSQRQVVSLGSASATAGTTGACSETVAGRAVRETGAGWTEGSFATICVNGCDAGGRTAVGAGAGCTAATERVRATAAAIGRIARWRVVERGELLRMAMSRVSKSAGRTI